MGGTGNDEIDGGEGLDYLHGQVGDDTLWGGEGTDADRLFGGDGSDIFAVISGHGNDVISGGNGSSWTDTIDIQEGAGWMLNLSFGHSIVSLNSYEAILTSDASGTLTNDAGDVINFSGIERLTF